MIDHSQLSSSGRISKRAAKAAQERTRRELFGDGLAFPSCPQPAAGERQRRLSAEAAERTENARRFRSERPAKGFYDSLRTQLGG